MSNQLVLELHRMHQRFVLLNDCFQTELEGRKMGSCHWDLKTRICFLVFSGKADVLLAFLKRKITVARGKLPAVPMTSFSK